MSKFFVARKPCGCITAAVMDGFSEYERDVADWLRRGDIVTYEERNGWKFEKCTRHSEEANVGH